MRSRRLFLASFAAALMATSGWNAVADNYPSRPISLIVPFAAGGPADVIARIIAERMRGLVGQPVIVENFAGAGGSVGTGRVTRAAPDGYTIMMGNWSTHVANGVLYSLPYDLMSDFQPVSLVANELDLIVARSSLPADNLHELIAWLKKDPGHASAATGGVGSPSHVAELLFAKQTQASIQPVPFRGAGPAVQELVAGRLDIMITGPSVTIPHLRSGTIKAFAVAAETRIALAPEIPTVDEAGLPGYHVAVWQALWAPEGTPKDIVAKLNAATHEALADSFVRKRLTDLGLEIPTAEQQGPEALRAFQKTEIEKWWPIIRAAEIRGE
jgi:tripartite-type tricarboxylate transporter receptor subunit TctC